MNQLARLLVFFAVSMALLVPASHAATSKTAVAKTTKSVKKTSVTKRVKSKRPVAASVRKTALAAPRAPAVQSYGEIAGLHQKSDALDLKSSVAYVIDQDTREVLLRKNDQAILPIASLTKLMTGLIINEANLPMDEMITITQDDVDTEKGSSSRLRVGTVLSRGELMHLALMSSENRAAHALGRSFPGGLEVFVLRMNEKARELQMNDTRYVEPTGLSSKNQSSAQDLAKLVNVAHSEATLRELSTSPNPDHGVPGLGGQAEPSGRCRARAHLGRGTGRRTQAALIPEVTAQGRHARRSSLA
jgi:serine-type D-Ala-D-Ala endopeptidase (penicillin-binding protein 7)